ncbi:MAG: penicillin-binding protein 1C [Hyphomicrobiales bacterium]|nr:penicillin-binding protein 1C [Hyphomicrobiales bacterium]
MRRVAGGGDQGPARRTAAALAVGARRICLSAIAAAGVGAAALSALDALAPAPALTAAGEASRLVLDRNGRVLRAYAISDGRWRLPAAARDVDPRYLAMLIAYEDKRFHSHAGVDLRAMGRALWQAARAGRPVSGASTLTMQTARLLVGAPTDSLWTKIAQIAQARTLDARLSKTDILDIYVRLAPFGGNLEGLRAASLAYFGKEPRRLAAHEAALLVALPQAPEARRPDRHPAAAKRARNRVLDRAVAAGVITRAEAEWAKSQPAPTRRREFPALAAHLADRLTAAHPSESVLRTTLDATLQEAAEAIAARQAAAHGAKLSAAVIVADHATGEVLAHAASAGYFDNARQGSIDMSAAVRSPGSALKPFIYGLAFEEGVAHPATLILDAPASFNGYSPQNFDKTYRGEVTAETALQLSLNVPAVKLLAAVTPARLASRFRLAGVGADIPRNLTVALGGVGFTLEEMTALYGSLGRGGEPVRLKFLRDGPMGATPPAPIRTPGPPLMSPAAAWYVTEALRNAPPPANAPPGVIAFKTGTSYGYRDAWAAGYDGRHVVAAWVGHADASPTPGLTGLVAAAPAVFDAFAALSPGREPFAPAPYGVLDAKKAELPPPLRRLQDPVASADVVGGAGLRIAFPPNAAEIELMRGENGGPLPVTLRAEGGAPPLTWLINGAVAATSHRRQFSWTPDGKGFAEVTLIDAAGRSQRVTVRIQ